MSRIHPEDPRLTAYVLGELPGTERAVVEKAAMTDPAVAGAIEETCQLAHLVQSSLGAQALQLDPDFAPARQALSRV